MLTSRISSEPVPIGKITLGGNNAITVQSMTNSDTNLIEDTVNQVKRIAEAGANLVRISVPSSKEVTAMREIKARLHADGYTLPLVADVHFNPKVAEAMATIVEKVRINPGNYVDKRVFNTAEMSEKEYAASLQKMSDKAKPLFEICKQNGTAIRIGVNHGSLCDRIINRYGNGPLAMAMSAIEWVDICEEQQFSQVLFSLKSSNVLTMIDSVTLLAKKMRERGRCYPLHLGVTEAGSGLDGRVKSAVGIGTLLLNGLGDTIRVSLTEKPENEIPFAQTLLKAVSTIPEDSYQILPERKLISEYAEPDRNIWMARMSSLCGYEHHKTALKDIVIHNPCFSQQENEELSAAILQACRIKISKTEIISCPTCARTQYDIESVLEMVKVRFSQIPGLKIGIMGCIVNGPGEMADADYGIVGATHGKVAVYRGKERISGVISVSEALDILEVSLTSMR